MVNSIALLLGCCSSVANVGLFLPFLLPVLVGSETFNLGIFVASGTSPKLYQLAAASVLDTRHVSASFSSR